VRILVLGLGNDIIADDAVGILCARRLRAELAAREPPAGGEGAGGDVEVVESAVAGIALLEHFADRDRAVVIDAVRTGRAPPGTVHELRPEDLGAVAAPSAHYAGLPEIFAVAEGLGIRFPAEVRILAVEVEDPLTIGGPVTPAVEAAIPEVVRRARAQVEAWLA
jgi:hydrogenase maturation protease